MDSSSGQRVNSTLVEVAFLGTIAFLAYQKILGETSVMTMLGIYATSRFGVGLVKRFVAGDAVVGLPPPMPPGAGGSGQSGGHRVTRGTIIESIPVSDDRFPPPPVPAHRPHEAPAGTTVPRPGPRKDPRRDDERRGIVNFVWRWVFTPFAYVPLAVAVSLAFLLAWSLFGGAVATIAHTVAR